MKRLAIIGSGDLGKQIAHYALSDNHYQKIFFIDDYATTTSINGIEVIGKTIDTMKLFDNNKFDELILGIGYKHLEKKKELFDYFQNKIPFGKIVHSSVWLDATAVVKAGCVVYPTCSIDAHSTIEENTVLNISCTIAHDTVIGKHCFLSPRVAIAGFVNVQELCILGINSTVIDNINIKAKTQLGGGTVVIKNITESGLYVGNPHRYIK